MAKPKQDAPVDLGGVTYSREELRTMFREAKRRGRESLRRNPVATAVSYDVRTRRVILSLSNRSELSVPVELLQGLSNATSAQLKDVVLMPIGTAIEWPQLDRQFSVAGLLAGVFGTASWMRSLERQSLLNAGVTKNKSARQAAGTKRRTGASAALA